MSAWRWIELTCDAADCPQNFREHMPTGSFEAARREAKTHGWSRKYLDIGHVDLCPEHAAYIGGDT